MRRKQLPTRHAVLRRKLGGDLGIILDDIQDLHNSVYIFRQFRELRLHNERLLRPAPFIEWLVENYVHSVAVGIRKQVKKSGISMASLLDHLLRNPGIITRVGYHAHFQDGIVDRDSINQLFDQVAGSGCDCIGSAVIQADLDKLRRECNKVEHLVDKRIAHYDRVDVMPVPTFGEIERAVATLEGVGRKYSVLLRGADRLFEFSYLEKWNNVLSFPWITTQADRGSA